MEYKGLLHPQDNSATINIQETSNKIVRELLNVKLALLSDCPPIDEINKLMEIISDDIIRIETAKGFIGKDHYGKKDFVRTKQHFTRIVKPDTDWSMLALDSMDLERLKKWTQFPMRAKMDIYIEKYTKLMRNYKALFMATGIEYTACICTTCGFMVDKY